MTTDRNLLFGAVAMQAGLITPDQFEESCSLWSARPSSSLLDILCEKGWLVAQDRVHVEYLVERKLAKFDGDVRATFAGCAPDVRNVLATIEYGPGVTSLAATAASRPINPGEIDSETPGPRYAWGALHAAGGIGEIWRATDTDLQREVAIKRLHANQLTSEIARLRFLREARITGQLDHPGVVPIYEICLDEETGSPYYSMRFLKGQTLSAEVAEYLERRKQTGADSEAFLRLLNAFVIVCNTVAFAHSKGIVHRDLKCENVILGDFGEVVVIDWGLAKEVGLEETAQKVELQPQDLQAADPLATLAGHVLGSPAYMAPEQAAGRLDLIGPLTDVYGLCAILYEILSGRPPFVGSNALEVLLKVQNESPRPPSDIVPGIPQALEDICLQGLAKSQQLRHASADHLARAVQRWVSDLAQHRQAEDERERFFALSLDLLAIIDDAGALRQVSPAWERLLGYDRRLLAGRPFAQFIHVDDWDGTQQSLQTATSGQTPRNFEARVTHADGTRRWISWNVTPIAKENCLYVVGRDITELKQSQQLFEGILQSAPDAMILIDPAGRIVLANRQAERLFQYSSNEMLGQPIEMLIPEQYREKHPQHVADFFAKSTFRPMGANLALRGLRKDGHTFAAEISLSSIGAESGKLVAASVRDISDRPPRS